jgi:hypothetical protein
MEMNGVSPGTPGILIGARPPSTSGGMVTTSRVADAKATRAGTSPTSTVGRSAGNPVPRIVSRPPSTARNGWTEVMVDWDEILTFES